VIVPAPQAVAAGHTVQVDGKKGGQGKKKPPPKPKTGKQQPQQQLAQQPNRPQPNQSKQQAKTGDRGAFGGKHIKKGSKFSYVAPWPENMPYLSKNGNTLTRECEAHFDGFCFRCGHSSHTHENCRVYNNKDVFITLCSVCRQGFHDSCRSRRWGLREEALSKKLEQVTQMCQMLSLTGQTAQSSKSRAPAIKMADTSSDED
jgi:hypothetical protein